MTIGINRGKDTAAAGTRPGKGTAPAAGIECRKIAASAVRRKHHERMQRRGRANELMRRRKRTHELMRRRGRAALSAPRKATPIQPGFSPSGRGGEL
jgi:hypothetical protein